jgi:uncharacterized membrane protein
MGNEKNNSKKKIFAILGLLFLIVSIIWTSLTGFENNKDRLVFIGLFILFFGLIALGVFLNEKMKKKTKNKSY